MKVPAPWTNAQVIALNNWQSDGRVHEFTCAKQHDGDRTLQARTDGWHCSTCGYVQNWAHDFMFKPIRIALLLKPD